GDAPEATEGTGTEILGSMQQSDINFFKSGKQWQHHKRQEDVTQAKHHRKFGVQQLQRFLDQPEAQQQVVDQSFVAEDKLQRVGTDQRIGPERQDHQEQQDRLPAF